jgi:hypothetical protein
MEEGGGMFVVHIINNNDFIVYLCIINDNALTSVVSILEHKNEDISTPVYALCCQVRAFDQHFTFRSLNTQVVKTIGAVVSSM